MEKTDGHAAGPVLYPDRVPGQGGKQPRPAVGIQEVTIVYALADIQIVLVRSFKAMLMGQYIADLCNLPLILFRCDLAAVIAFLKLGASAAGLRNRLGLLFQPSLMNGKN